LSNGFSTAHHSQQKFIVICRKILHGAFSRSVLDPVEMESNSR